MDDGPKNRRVYSRENAIKFKIVRQDNNSDISWVIKTKSLLFRSYSLANFFNAPPGIPLQFLSFTDRCNIMIMIPGFSLEFSRASWVHLQVRWRCV